MTLDDGSTYTKREGVGHQSSLRTNQNTKGLFGINKPMLGIVLKVHPSDSPDNHNSFFFSDRRSYTAVCDVLIVEDGKGSYFKKDGVIIPPAHPSGLDSYEEQLPRGCGAYIHGEPYDSSLSTADIKDLDGDWCIVSFVGGQEQQAYVSNWWPHPRNTLDPQTEGSGAVTEDGEPTTLVQQQLGNGRYFKRINGVEYVVNGRGDIFISTHYAGGILTPNAEGSTTNGRFSREIQPGPGGGIRINVKPSQPLELSWSTQADGVGLFNMADPSLPQTNPPQTQPILLTEAGTYIKVTNNMVSFQTPRGFNVKTTNVRLDAGGEFVIMGGTEILLKSLDTIALTSSNSLYLVCDAGPVYLNSGEDEVTITANSVLRLNSEDDDIILTVIQPAHKILLGNEFAEEPLIKGTAFSSALFDFLTALKDFVASPLAPLPVAALQTQIATFEIQIAGSLSETVFTK